MDACLSEPFDASLALIERLFRGGKNFQMSPERDYWTKSITSRRNWLDLRVVELWNYRHLILLFIVRDLRAGYKQTILGRLWIFIPILLSTSVFSIVFGDIAKLSSDGAPHGLFYWSGLLMWGYFSSCIVGNSNIFNSYAGLFSKVYFPRLVVYFANIGAATFSIGIQIVLFLIADFYFWHKGAIPGPNWAVVFLPVLFMFSAAIGLGIGSIASSLTAKYRDLTFLINYGMQLWMYATPIIYPLSSVAPKYRPLALLNPLTSIVETFRYAFLGTGAIPYDGLVFTALFSAIVFLLGIIVFNRVEATAMDTV